MVWQHYQQELYEKKQEESVIWWTEINKKDLVKEWTQSNTIVLADKSLKEKQLKPDDEIPDLDIKPANPVGRNLDKIKELQKEYNETKIAIDKMIQELEDLKSSSNLKSSEIATINSTLKLLTLRSNEHWKNILKIQDIVKNNWNNINNLKKTVNSQWHEILNIKWGQEIITHQIESSFHHLEVQSNVIRNIQKVQNIYAHQIESSFLRDAAQEQRMWNIEERVEKNIQLKVLKMINNSTILTTTMAQEIVNEYNWDTLEFLQLQTLNSDVANIIADWFKWKTISFPQINNYDDKTGYYLAQFGWEEIIMCGIKQYSPNSLKRFQNNWWKFQWVWHYHKQYWNTSYKQLWTTICR